MVEISGVDSGRIDSDLWELLIHAVRSAEDVDGRYAIGCDVSEENNTSRVSYTGCLFSSNDIDSLCLHFGDDST